MGSEEPATPEEVAAAYVMAAAEHYPNGDGRREVLLTAAAALRHRQHEGAHRRGELDDIIARWRAR